MGIFFKKDSKRNKYLEDQEALFETKGETKQNKQEDNYDQYIIGTKDYSNVPKYKAADERNVQVVIDKEQLGYQELNSGVNTVEMDTRDLYADLSEIVNNAPIDEKTNEVSKSIYDKTLKEDLRVEEPIDVIEIDNTELVISGIFEEKVAADKKLSIFGKADAPIQAKVYDVKEAPIVEKIEVVDINPKDDPKPEVKLNEQGKKICTQCGAPLNPEATVCFLCGKSV